MSTSDSIALGFGFVPGETTHYFLVTIPRGEEGDVVIAGPFVNAPDEEGDGVSAGHLADDSAVEHPKSDDGSTEHLAGDGDAEDPIEGEEASGETRPLVALSLERWLCIEHAVRVEFNRRLRRMKCKPGIWKNGPTLLAAPFGKELTLLCWAIEEAEIDQVANAFLNWAWFTPEERQQLYGIVAALSGAPEQAQESPWRRAIRIALVETSVEDRPNRPKPKIKATPPAPTPPAIESARSRKKRTELDSLLAQPTLPCLEDGE